MRKRSGKLKTGRLWHIKCMLDKFSVVRKMTQITRSLHQFNVVVVFFVRSRWRLKRKRPLEKHTNTFYLFWSGTLHTHADAFNIALTKSIEKKSAMVKESSSEKRERRRRKKNSISRMKTLNREKYRFGRSRSIESENAEKHLRWIRVGHLFEALPFLISHQLFMLLWLSTYASMAKGSIALSFRAHSRSVCMSFSPCDCENVCVCVREHWNHLVLGCNAIRIVLPLYCIIYSDTIYDLAFVCLGMRWMWNVWRSFSEWVLLEMRALLKMMCCVCVPGPKCFIRASSCSCRKWIQIHTQTTAY